MNLNSRSAVVSIALSLFASVPLLAQQLDIDPSPVLTGGARATVTYTNPSLAGQEVLVVVTGHDSTTQQIHLLLDSSGRGIGSITVPSTWRSAEFQAPSVANQVLPVQ